jgi:hypothetical protein
MRQRNSRLQRRSGQFRGLGRCAVPERAPAVKAFPEETFCTPSTIRLEETVACLDSARDVSGQSRAKGNERMAATAMVIAVSLTGSRGRSCHLRLHPNHPFVIRVCLTADAPGLAPGTDDSFATVLPTGPPQSLQRSARTACASRHTQTRRVHGATQADHVDRGCRQMPAADTTVTLLAIHTEAHFLRSFHACSDRCSR